MSVVRALRLAEASAPDLRLHKRSPTQQKAWQNVTGMEPRTLEYISIASGGELSEAYQQVLVRRVCIDSRQIRQGDLFVALKGQRFDGHAFLNQAAEQGAAGVLVDRSSATQPLSCPKIIVADTRRALGRLAACYRTEFDLPIVAVGGSNGKTTTKEILRAVLGGKLHALCSESSFNNDIGVPLTLLNLNEGHQVAVLEVGTNHPGEIAPLVQMIQPRFGIITSIGREHLEFFGDLAGVAEEEGWLAELLPAYGKLFINGDSEYAPAIEKRCRADIVRVGFTARNDWRVEKVETTQTGISFTVAAPLPEFAGEYKMPLFGRHQAVNAAFALAIGGELGLAPRDCRRGLEKCEPPSLRIEVWQRDGAHVLDDSYNANSDSMLAALETLRDFPCKGRRIAVIGDMGELGEHTTDAHREVGRRSAEFGVSHLVAVGRSAELTAEAARAAGIKDVIVAADIPAIITHLKDLLRAGDAVLIKASRSAGLDRIGEALGRLSNGNGKNHS